MSRSGANYVVQRPRHYHAGNYPSLSAMFTARNLDNGPAVMDFEPLATYQAAELRLDKPDTIINGNGATITLPPGNDQTALRIGVDAIRLRLKDFNLAGNYATQTGTSTGIEFEDYTDIPFRYSDRTSVEDLNIDGFLTTGARIGLKRLHVVFTRTFIRDSGLYGLDMNASDCRFLDGAIGGVRGSYGVRVNQGAFWLVNNGVYSNQVAAVLLTDKASGCKIMNNDLDNNMGSGLHAIGLAGNTLNTTISGNHFRGNSTAGDGISSDVYLEQVNAITFENNRFYSQLGSTARTKYNVDIGAGVTGIRDTANDGESTYPTLGRWSAAAAAVRINRAYSLDLIQDGGSDVQIRRQGVGVEVNNDFTSLGTSLGSRLSANGTGGNGFYQMVEQSADPAAPAVNQWRLFAKDNGAGKTQFVVRFNTGAPVVIATEP